jgi:hypothetical protein
MTQKPKKKTLFFLTFFLSIFFLNISTFAVAQTYTWNKVTIDATWLSVNVGGFQGSTDGTGHLQITSGGVSVETFRNEGKIESEEGTLAWKSYVEFRFALNIYTDALPENVIVGDLNKKITKTYATVWAFPSTALGNYPVDDDRHYNSLQKYPLKLSWRTAEINGMYTHDYNGKLPISLDLKEDFEGRTYEINGVEIKNVKIMSEIKDVVVDVFRANSVADYNDKYISNFDDVIKNSGASVEDLGESVSFPNSPARQDLNEQLEDLGLNEKYPISDAKTLTYGSKSGQSIVRGKERGAKWSNPESDDTIDFDLAMRIKPAITYKTQTIRWTECKQINYDYEDVFGSPAAVKLISPVITHAGEDSYNPRIASVHVDNQWIRQEFIVRCNLIANGEIDASHAEDVDLDDPAVEAGDFMWDSDFGSSSATMTIEKNPFTKFLDFLTNPMGLIFFIAIIVLIIAVVAISFFKFSPVSFIMRFLDRGKGD